MGRIGVLCGLERERGAGDIGHWTWLSLGTASVRMDVVQARCRGASSPPYSYVLDIGSW